MLVPDDVISYILDWATWLIIGVGLAVTVLVFVVLSRVRRRRRREAIALENEELPWERLLELLRKRHRQLAGSDALGDGDLAPEQLLSLLLAQSPGKLGNGAANIPPEVRASLAKGIDRRSSRRRWGNPTEVCLNSHLLASQLRGLVINRSATGLAIFVNREIPPGTALAVRAVEAPSTLPPVQIAVKYCRKTKRNYIIGCHSTEEIPWNIRGWLG
jgi:hypothetical protein